MIRVLIVDDSPTARKLLVHMVTTAPDMTVVGQAENGKQGVEMVQRLRPDVVLMDVTMPVMDGLEATGHIMAVCPTPIVMVSASIAGRETEMAFEALHRGALTLLNKPAGPDDPQFQQQYDQVVRAVRNMAGVRVIHHRTLRRPASRNGTAAVPDLPEDRDENIPELVAVVASTGGPAALAKLVQGLPAGFAPPMVIVQHIAHDFLLSLRDWLDSLTPHSVVLAEAGKSPQPGHIYFAPGGKHLEVTSRHTFRLADEPITGHMPSGDVLLHTIARHYGSHAAGIIMTGMGADGADGLLAMRRAGAITVAQDKASCAVYGMPAEAVARNAARHVLSLTGIIHLLSSWQSGE